jgi:hypothetical protein
MSGSRIQWRVAIACVALAILSGAGLAITQVNFERVVNARFDNTLASVDLRRGRIWWFAGGIGAGLYILAGAWIVALRRASRNPLFRAILVVALVVGFALTGPLSVSTAIAATRTHQPFWDCVFPAPLLIWSPSIIGALGILCLAFKERHSQSAAA